MSTEIPVSDPLALLVAWRDEAEAEGLVEPDSMYLATVGPGGAPSLRTVLFRGISGGGLRFFTNYESRKGRELAGNPAVALLFHWPSRYRQIRVEGAASRLAPEESDAYFHQRPRGSQLGAWASPQSQPIATLDDLRRRHAALEALYEGRAVPRPAHWGGYRVVPRAIEFWTAGADRLHDRVLYVRDGDGWRVTRLAP